MNDIAVIDVNAVSAEKLIVQEAKAVGYLGFYRRHESEHWSNINIFDPIGTSRDYYRTPFPLAETRERVIEEGKKCLPGGGELRIVRIEL